MKLIAGDIGGTKTTLALYDSGAGTRRPIVEKTYESSSYGSFEDVIRAFMSDFSLSDIHHASFGVAGPIMGDRAEITNLKWVIEKSSLLQQLGFSDILLINDLEAVAHSIDILTSTDLEVINEGSPVTHGPRAVIAPGTGLGEAYLSWDGSRYVPHASEGGHTEFGPSNAMEIELLSYLLKKFDHVSYELVCSGIGIPNIYDFLKDTGRYQEPEWLADKIKKSPDRTPAIRIEAYESETRSEICRAAMEMFISILGAEAGNLGLKVMATGGIYVGGGISPRIMPALREGTFLNAFFRKGRLSKVIRTMPVSVILNSGAGLMGAAAAGFNHLGVKAS